ncbi:DUF493 domain-containing protein [Corticibacter populi]|uniref:UPF0250 protein D8I35_04780 n=1 Tax=Corticibacter populi TaxID=1550736 RepID=A0A3M6QZE3_9BURK|nr:DUF493 domain-containing protein [Corticibacter populi]RMX08404.1 DUF493 domain-containing protein [Corticibacter populi]RZS35707.1 hypothetical protein EV687_0784 [Corticibacter populi]
MSNIPSAPNTPPEPASRQDTLIEYPSAFPIKAMGLKHDDLVPVVTGIARKHDPFFDDATIELRESQTGKYLGVTITITATSREQLDAIYRELSSHELIQVVL